MNHNGSAANNKRDISHFLLMRVARQDDDKQVGELLLRAFEQTYRYKLPEVFTNRQRKIELMDVESRREEGVVYVLELGYRIIGTFALMPPSCGTSQSWVANSANLRCVALDPDFHGYGFSEMMLEEAERIARNWKCEAIVLHVQDGAEGVARLYQKKGFIRDPEGDMMSYDNQILGYRLSLDQKLNVMEPEKNPMTANAS